MNKMNQDLPHGFCDPVGDHDGDLFGCVHPPQGVGQDQTSQRVGVICGQRYPRLFR